MSVGAHFQINQAINPIPTGTLDVARTDLRVGGQIHFVGDPVGNSSPSWTIQSWPAGSARGTPANSTTFDATYTPDVPGEYKIQFLVNDGIAGNAKTLVFCCTRDVNGLIYDNGLRAPAFGETIGDDNTSGNDRSYAKPYEATLAADIPVIDNIATLLTLRANRHTQIRVKGYYQAGDGVTSRGYGGGMFHWSASSTAAHNGGTIFQPGFGTAAALATGRWIRSNASASRIHLDEWGIVDDHLAAIAGVANPSDINRDQAHALSKFCYTLTTLGYSGVELVAREGFFTFSQVTTTYTAGSVVNRRARHGWSLCGGVTLRGEAGMGVIFKAANNNYAVLQINANTIIENIAFDNCQVGVQLCGWGAYGTGDALTAGPPALLITSPIYFVNCEFRQNCVMGVWRDKTPLSVPAYARSMQSLLVFDRCRWVHSQHGCWIDNDETLIINPLFGINQGTDASPKYEVDSLGMPLGFLNVATGHCKITNPVIEQESALTARTAFAVGKAFWDVTGSIEFDGGQSTAFRLRSADNTYQGLGEGVQVLDGDDSPGGISLTGCYLNTNSQSLVEIYGKLPINFIIRDCTYGTAPSIGTVINSDTVAVSEYLSQHGQSQNWHFDREDWTRIRYCAEAHMRDPIGTSGVVDITDSFVFLLRPNGTEELDLSQRINLHTVNTESASAHLYDPVMANPSNISGTVPIETSTGHNVRVFTVTGGIGGLGWSSGNLSSSGPGVRTYKIRIRSTAPCDMFFVFAYDGQQSESRLFRVLKGDHDYWIPFYFPDLSGGHTFTVGGLMGNIPNGTVFSRFFPTIVDGYGPGPWQPPVDNAASPTTNLVTARKTITYHVDALPVSGDAYLGDRWIIDTPSLGSPAAYICTTAGTIGAGAVLTPIDYAFTSAPVLSARTLTAGAGLAGGGDLSANRTFDVGQNADGSVVVNANDIQVSAAIQAGAALGATSVQVTRTVTGASPISVNGDHAAHALSSDLTIDIDGVDVDVNSVSTPRTTFLVNSGGTLARVAIGAADAGSHGGLAFGVTAVNTTNFAVVGDTSTTFVNAPDRNGSILLGTGGAGFNSGVIDKYGFQINSFVLTSPTSLANFATGGVIGTATATVDFASLFSVQQSTAGQTLTLPNPTILNMHRIICIVNSGSASFTMYGQIILPSQSAMFVFSRDAVAWRPITGTAGAVPLSRTLTAGAGLTGGGDLSSDRTIDVAANVDGSIVVNANDIQVGVLATDAQHGTRGGGALHAIATTSVAGFMSAADKTVLNSLSAGSVPSTRQVIAGAGLTGGGALSSDVTLDVVAADSSIAVTANNIKVGTLPNGLGFFSSAPPGITSTGITLWSSNDAWQLYTLRIVQADSTTETLAYPEMATFPGAVLSKSDIWKRCFQVTTVASGLVQIDQPFGSAPCAGKGLYQFEWRIHVYTPSGTTSTTNGQGGYIFQRSMYIWDGANLSAVNTETPIASGAGLNGGSLVESLSSNIYRAKFTPSPSEFNTLSWLVYLTVIRSSFP